MSMLTTILSAFGLQLAETTEERKVLDRLAYCTANHEEYMRALQQAVIIAQAGGTTDEKLEAMLHLGAVEMMTPSTEQALHSVGIDTRPWAVVSEEWKAGRP